MSAPCDVHTAEGTASERDERLAKVTAPMNWKIAPVTDLTHIDALPPAAKERELKKAADTFASTARNVFVHYVSPILLARRKLHLASNTTKKNFPKTAAQLWQIVDGEQAFFWNEAARELRWSLRQRSLSTKGCVLHAGRLRERDAYIWRAEVAVATYLGLPLPRKKQNEESEVPKETEDSGLLPTELQDKLDTGALNIITPSQHEKEAALAHGSTTCMVQNDEAENLDLNNVILFDTLPDRFQYEPRMLYSHFAHYDFNKVRMAEGKHQTAMLRQLADLFDKTGKVLFYYYTVPRLCKQSQPPKDGNTVTSKAAELWRFLSGREKSEWLEASACLKRRLGDGEIEALGTLRLDGLGDEVLRLHGMAQRVLEGAIVEED